MKRQLHAISKYLPQLALLAAASVFSLVIGEVLCRLAPQYNDTNPVYVLPHPTLPYTMLPNFSGTTILGRSIDINSRGFRDSEHSLQREAGVKRIIALGDSTTFGYGVEIRESYPKIIEQLLNTNAAPRRYEVLNFGHSGFNLVDYYNLFESSGRKHSPDVLVVGLMSNDYTRDQYREVIRDGIGMRPGSVWTTYHVPSIILRTLRKSALFLTVGNAVKRLSAAKGAPAGAQDSSQEAMKTKAFVSQYLSKLSALAGHLDIPIVYAFFPKQTEVVSGSAEYPDFIALIAMEARKNRKVRFVNLMEDLRPYKNTPEEVFLQQDWVHPTPRGHEIYAKRIAAEVRNLELSNSASKN